MLGPQQPPPPLQQRPLPEAVPLPRAGRDLGLCPIGVIPNALAAVSMPLWLLPWQDDNAIIEMSLKLASIYAAQNQ